MKSFSKLILYLRLIGFLQQLPSCSADQRKSLVGVNRQQSWAHFSPCSRSQSPPEKVPGQGSSRTSSALQGTGGSSCNAEPWAHLPWMQNTERSKTKNPFLSLQLPVSPSAFMDQGADPPGWPQGCPAATRDFCSCRISLGHSLTVLTPALSSAYGANNVKRTE